MFIYVDYELPCYYNALVVNTEVPATYTIMHTVDLVVSTNYWSLLAHFTVDRKL
jgi:hypothetical protein